LEALLVYGCLCFGVIDICFIHILGILYMVVMVHCKRNIFVIVAYIRGISYGIWYDACLRYIVVHGLDT
jgi:hypothetical protein